MVSSPRISVIVPVFKTAKYLKKCLDSILEQTFRDFEIILVSEGIEEDDRICREYEQNDFRIRCVKNSYRGLGGARNTGLDVSRGEFISFIDSDDWVDPSFLMQLYDGMQQGTDIVQCGTNIVFEDKISLKQKASDEEYFSINRQGVIFLDNNLFGGMNVGSWNKLYRKSLIDRYNLRFPEDKRNEDAYFTWAYWAVSEKMYCVPVKLYNYLRRENSLMAKTFAKNMGEAVIDHLDVGEDFYKFLIENNLWEKRQEAFYRAYVICYFFVRDNASLMYREIGHQKAREFLKQIEISEKQVLLRQIVKYPYKRFSLNPKNRFVENIFSYKKSYNEKHKIFTVCGLKLKLKQK